MLSLLLLVFNCPVFLPVLGANVVRMETFEPAHNWLSMETSVDSLLSVLHFSVKVTSPQALYLVSMDNQLCAGSNVSILTTFAPNTGKKTGQLKTSYKRDNINATLDTDFNFSGPLLQGSAVVGYEGWLAGYQFAFDSSAKALTKNNFALGFTGEDMQLLCAVDDGSRFNGSVFQKVNAQTKVGVQLAWDKGSSNTSFGLASKYTIDDDSSLAVKVGNNGSVGCAYSHKLKAGVTLTLSSLLNATKLNEGGHKLGLGVEFAL